MKNRFYLLSILVSACLYISCSPTNVIIDDYTSPQFNREVIRTVALFDIMSDQLSDTEKKQIEDKFLTELRLKYKDVAFFGKDYFKDSVNENDFSNSWNEFWGNYLNSKEVDAVELFQVAEKVKTNAVLQIGLVDVDKVFGEHRKTIGQTTAKLKLALFSLKSGKLLWEAVVSGTQANAHSDQVIPKVVEAVNVAITNIADKLPFK